MRTDLVDIALALIVLAAFVMVWRAEGDDPTWQERWRALSAADRSRIAATARSGDLLASQEEIELAAGYARRSRRRRHLASRQRSSHRPQPPRDDLPRQPPLIGLNER